MRRLETLLRAHEAVSDAMNDAADDVIEAAREKNRKSPTKTGPLKPFRSAELVRWVRITWTQAKSKLQRNDVRRKLREGIEHGLIGLEEGAKLSKEIGDDE